MILPKCSFWVLLRLLTKVSCVSVPNGAYSCRPLRLGPAILSYTVLMLNLSEYVRGRDLGGEEKQNSNRKDFLKR
jgi:hypothetical protein